MSLSASLQFKQSQSLVMTPQLMQSIRLLQFNPHELMQFIESQVQSNPLLELAGSEHAGGDHEPDRSSMDDTPRSTSSSDEHIHLKPVADGEMGDISNMESTLDVNLRNIYPDDEAMRAKVSDEKLSSYKINSVGEVAVAGSDIDFDSFASASPSMRDTMASQIGESIKSAADRMIATELVDHLDEAGYLQIDLDALAARLGIDCERLEQVISTVQHFDPPGMFARDLKECLKLQLSRKNRLDPAMEVLIDNLALLAKRDFATLKNLSNVEDQDLLQMVSEIQSLDPKPGTHFEVSSAQTVIPDVIITENDDGSWHVEMNSDTLPRLLVNQTYYADVTTGLDKASTEYNFMNDCLQSAHWLTRSLDQRVQTIIKVASEIVKQQDKFFAEGVSHLKPLNLKTIAEKIDMHESTVSRVTSNKYMMTPRGLFELKYFFTVSIAGSEGGDAHSAEAIRHRIKNLINAETVKKILSDDDIVKALREENIDIARRTVAKYREAMNIASSVQRRREKKLLAQHGQLPISA